MYRRFSLLLCLGIGLFITACASGKTAAPSPYSSLKLDARWLTFVFFYTPG